MIALSTISITAIEIVSEASASGIAALSASPAPQQRQHRQRVAEEEGEHDREHDRREVAPAQRGADDHPEHLADRAAGEAVHRGAEREPVEAQMPAAWFSVSPS